ncbi:MAG: hypothetical protein ACKV22_32565 [Bryobacteraceae bacterium]
MKARTVQLVQLLLCLSICGAVGYAQETWHIEPVNGLLATDSHVYWFRDCGSSFTFSTTALTRKSPRAGSLAVPEALYNPGSCTPSRVASNNVALDGGFVYYLAGDGRIVSISLSLPGLGPLTHSTIPATPVATMSGIAVDASYIYWHHGNRVYRAPKAPGGASTLIYTAGAAVREFRAARDGTLMFIENTSLVLLRPSSGSVYTRSSLSFRVMAYAYVGDRIYWTQGDVSASYFEVRSSTTTSGATVLHYRSASPMPPRTHAFTSDGTNAYWYAGRRLYRVALHGGTPISITPDISTVTDLQFASGYLFWTDYAMIYRLGAASAPVPPPGGDIRITGVEITQGIQTPSNDIPLIGDKLTYIRVYAQSREDSNGPWGGVSAEAIFAGSVVRNRSRYTRLSPSGSNRSTLDDSLLIPLAPEDTRPGTRLLTVNLIGPYGREEADLSNNVASVMVTFQNPIHLTVYGMAYRNEDNPSSCSYGAVADPAVMGRLGMADTAFLQNTYPVSTYTVVPLPGNGRSFDNSGCLAFQAAGDWVFAQLDRIDSSGGMRGFYLAPEYAHNGRVGNCCRGSGSNWVFMLGNDIGSGDTPGSTVAHELGHSWGLGHPQDPAEGYPWPANTIGPQVGLKTYPGTPPIVRTQPGMRASGSPWYGDFMQETVGSNRWISPYNFCRLLNSISGGGVVCSPTAMQASADGPSWKRLRGTDGEPLLLASSSRGQVLRVLLGSGSFQAKGAAQAPVSSGIPVVYISGNVDIGPAVYLNPFEIWREIKQPTTLGAKGSYHVRFEGAKGETLLDHAFDMPKEVHENMPKAPPPQRFAFFLPWNPGTKRIVVTNGQVELASRSVTANAPSVEFRLPDGVAACDGKMTLRWDAKDFDGDPLVFSLWYSADGGQKWIPLDHGVTGSSHEVNCNELPGSKSGQFRVLASDGVNTTQALYPQPVAIQLKAPAISMALPADRVLVFAAPEPVVLQASAFDLEDGPMVNHAAFSWFGSKGELLGRGRWLTPQLANGTHRVTLIVVDGSGQSSMTSFTVVVQ